MLRALPLFAIGTMLAAGCALAACSSDDTFEELHAFTDSASRSCEAQLVKTSPTSPSVGQSISCDGTGRTCSDQSASCFVLSLDTETRLLRNCPACCKGAASSFFNDECSSLVCESDADCVYAEATCVEGLCSCASGYCE